MRIWSQNFVLIQPRTSPPKNCKISSKLSKFANFPNFANLNPQRLRDLLRLEDLEVIPNQLPEEEEKSQGRREGNQSVLPVLLHLEPTFI